jgi:predicted transposase YbfD/YdcC
MDGFKACFAELADPRTGNAGRHDMVEMLFIAVATLLMGGHTCTAMAMFAEERIEYLRQFLPLENGPPSHDTFSRLFRLLDPKQFHACFQVFMSRFFERLKDVIAVDGKVMRGSLDSATDKSATHIVSAWACENQLVLGQIACDVKSNEITAVPKLLKLLSLEGCIVTVDAINTQRAIGKQVVEQDGDYVMALKDNHPKLFNDVKDRFEDPNSQAAVGPTTTDGDHGRIETRTATVLTDIASLQAHHKWPGLRAIGMVERTREVKGVTSVSRGYYLLSAPLTPERLCEVTRAHWGVENRLHWRLDVSMNEDRARNRMGNGAECINVLRHMVLNILRKDPSKGSLPMKFMRASLSESYMTSLFTLF